MKIKKKFNSTKTFYIPEIISESLINAGWDIKEPKYEPYKLLMEGEFIMAFNKYANIHILCKQVDGVTYITTHKNGYPPIQVYFNKDNKLVLEYNNERSKEYTMKIYIWLLIIIHYMNEDRTQTVILRPKCKDKANKIYNQSKSPIYVVDSSWFTEYVLNAHTRRGHYRMQAYGPGRRLRKEIFIPDTNVKQHKKRSKQKLALA